MRTQIADAVYLYLGFLGALLLIMAPFWVFISVMVSSWFLMRWSRSLFDAIFTPIS